MNIYLSEQRYPLAIIDVHRLRDCLDGVKTELCNSVFITYNPKKVGLTKKVYLEKFLSVVSLDSQKKFIWKNF